MYLLPTGLEPVIVPVIADNDNVEPDLNRFDLVSLGISWSQLDRGLAIMSTIRTNGHKTPKLRRYSTKKVFDYQNTQYWITDHIRLNRYALSPWFESRIVIPIWIAWNRNQGGWICHQIPSRLGDKSNTGFEPIWFGFVFTEIVDLVNPSNIMSTMRPNQLQRCDE
jgi:hypothetical protein